MRAFALAAGLAAVPARAGADPLAADLRIDVPVTAAIFVGLVGLAVFEEDLARDSCGWCEPGGFDGALRSDLRWSDGSGAAAASDVLAFALVPAVAVGGILWTAQDERDDLGVDGLVLTEAVLAAGLVNETFKRSVGRARPYTLDQPREARASPSANEIASFYSGHTSMTFAMVVASGTIASMRGRRSAPWVFAIGLPLAALTGYLRIAADRHYATDVLAGAAFGSLFGFGVPWLHGL